MSRHLRNNAHPCPEPVSSYPVAPDHYANPDLPTIDDTPGPDGMRIRDWIAAQPYHAGDVVWFEYNGLYGKQPRKAFISGVWVDYDRYGDRRPKFRVHLANKTGDRFAKNWFYTWPGFIERGYKLAATAEQPA